LDPEVPAGVPILRDRWAYDDKLAPGGKIIERFKARLTAMGCFQKEGIDFTDTYASVMATRTFRMILTALQQFGNSFSRALGCFHCFYSCAIKRTSFHEASCWA
jgi:hypothetical protein